MQNYEMLSQESRRRRS